MGRSFRGIYAEVVGAASELPDEVLEWHATRFRGVGVVEPLLNIASSKLGERLGVPNGGEGFRVDALARGVCIDRESSRLDAELERGIAFADPKGSAPVKKQNLIFMLSSQQGEVFSELTCRGTGYNPLRG